MVKSAKACISCRQVHSLVSFYLKVHFLYNVEIHCLFGLEYCIYVYVSSITTTDDSVTLPVTNALFCFVPEKLLSLSLLGYF